MKKPPTTENPTHDQHDAPAEGGARFTISLENLERVHEYDDLRSLLCAISATAQVYAQRHPEDHDAQGIAAILTALEHAHRHPDDPDPEAQGFRDAVGKWDANHPSGLQWHVREYMQKPFRGPRTLEQQANMLWNRVVTDLKDSATLQQVAENFVAHLRIAPDIAKHTCVPTSPGGWRGTDAEAKAVRDVERALRPKRRTCAPR